VISLPFLDVLNIKSGPVAHAFTVIHAFMVQTVWYLRVFFRLDRVLPKFVYLIIVLGPALLFGGILALVMPSEWQKVAKVHIRERNSSALSHRLPEVSKMMSPGTVLEKA
jgi:hypothetical protein